MSLLQPVIRRLRAFPLIIGTCAALLLSVLPASLVEEASGNTIGGSSPVVASQNKPADGEYGTETWKDPADSLLPEPTAFLPRVRDAFGSRFGGAWIERPEEPAERDKVAWQRVAVAGATDADEELLAELSGDNPYVTIVPVKYRLDALTAWKEMIAKYLVGAATSAWLVDADETKNGVVVTMLSPPPGLGEYARLNNIPDDAWTVIRASAEYRLDHATRAEYPPYEGALRADMHDLVGNPTGTCTTGFTLVTDLGNYKATTNGHCEYSTSDHMWIDETDLGDGALNSYLGAASTSSDAVRYSIASAHATRRVLLAANTHANIANRFYATGGEPQVGTSLCWLGAVSGGNNCGEVLSADFTISTGSPIRHHVWMMETPGQGGDSGGPVYRTNSDGTKKAAGMRFGTCCTGNPTRTLLHHITYILGDLDANLYTG